MKLDTTTLIVMCIFLITGVVGMLMPVKGKKGWRWQTISEQKSFGTLIISIYAIFIFGKCIWM